MVFIFAKGEFWRIILAIQRISSEIDSALYQRFEMCERS